MTVIGALQNALAGAQGDLAKAWMAIRRVRDIHKPNAKGDQCVACGFEDDESGYWDTYPCATLRALDGEQK